MPSASKKIVIEASRDTMFQIITDYERYPRFLSTINKVKVLERTKSVTVVEFQANVIKPFRYTLELKEKEPSTVTWRLLDGDFMRKNEGSWKLKNMGASKTEATYEITVEVSPLVPGFLTQMLIDKSLPTTLDEFRIEAENFSIPKPKKRSTSKRGA